MVSIWGERMVEARVMYGPTWGSRWALYRATTRLWVSHCALTNYEANRPTDIPLDDSITLCCLLPSDLESLDDPRSQNFPSNPLSLLDTSDHMWSTPLVRVNTPLSSDLISDIGVFPSLSSERMARDVVVRLYRLILGRVGVELSSGDLWMEVLVV